MTSLRSVQVRTDLLNYVTTPRISLGDNYCDEHRALRHRHVTWRHRSSSSAADVVGYRWAEVLQPAPAVLLWCMNSQLGQKTEAIVCFWAAVSTSIIGEYWPNLTYIKSNLCVFFVPYTRPQFWADLHEIWHVASLYHTDDHGGSQAPL